MALGESTYERTLKKLSKQNIAFQESKPKPDKKRNRHPILVPAGSTGTENYGGFIQEKDFTPPDLQSTDRADTFEKMYTTDAVVKASYLAVTLPIRAAKKSIIPEDPDEPRAVEIAEWIEDNFLRSFIFDFNDTYREILTYLIYGFAPFGKYFDVVENEIKLVRLEIRLQNTIDQWILKNGNLESIVQNALQDNGNYEEVTIPRNQLAYFVNDRIGSDYRGQSILRAAYGAWWRRTLLLKIEAIKHERYGSPTPVIKLNPGYTDADFEAAQAIGEAYRVHEKAYLVEPPEGEVRFLDPGRNAGTNIHESIQRESGEILLNTLSQVLNLGNTETGSRALGESFNTFLLNSLQFIADYSAEVIRKDIFKPWIDAQFGPQKTYPKLEITKIQKPDANTVFTNLPTLIEKNAVTPDEELEKSLRNMMDLPEKDDETERRKIVVSPQTQNPINQPEDQPGDQEGDQEGKGEGDQPENPNKMCDHNHTHKYMIAGRELWRQPTQLEEAMGIVEKAQIIDDEKDRFIEIGNRYKREIVKELTKKGVSLLSRKLDFNTFIDKLNEINIPMIGKFENELTKELKNIFNMGRSDVKAELDGMKFQDPLTPITDEPGEAQKAVRPLAKVAIMFLIDVFRRVFNKEMIRQKQNGLIESGTLGATLSNVVGADFKRNMREVVNNVYGLGRNTEGAKQPDVTIVRSELMDTNTCQPCRNIDGNEYNINDPEYQSVAGGIYINCEGGDQCRGMNIFIRE